MTDFGDFDRPQPPASAPDLPGAYAWQPTPPVGEIAPEPAPRPKHTRRNVALAAVALVAVLALVGGLVIARGSDSSAAPAVVLSSAAGKTTKTGTAHLTEKVTAVADGDKTSLVNIDADEDFGRQAAEIEICSARNGVCVERLRVVNGTTYAQSPRVPLPNDAEWVSITASDLGKAKSVNAGTGNPSDGLSFLSMINPGSIVDNGESTEQGVKVRKYDFTVNLKPMLEAEASGVKKLHVPQMAEALRSLDGLVDLTKLPGSASIDDQGRVRTFEYRFHVDQDGHSGTVTGALTFSDFDKPVNITEPLPATVVPFSQFPNFFSKMAQP